MSIYNIEKERTKELDLNKIIDTFANTKARQKRADSAIEVIQV